MMRAWAPALVLLLVSLRGTCASNPSASDPTSPGPCGSRSFRLDFNVPQDLAALGKTIPVTFTVPATCPGPAPIVVFYSGFQASASAYTQYAQYATSHGYTVVQYDIGSLALLAPASISDEVKLFKPLLAWVARQSRTRGSPAFRTADARRVLTAGHSRGGKLAALTLGTYYVKQGGPVAGGFLIDPVDSSSFNPISPGNPSGAAAVKKAGAPVAVVGAGLTGQCNPAEGNYAKFYAAGARGSWEVVVPGASHVTFVDAGPAGNALQDRFCGAGTATRVSTIQLTQAPMVAWFGRALGVRTPPGQPGPLAQFYAWEAEQVAAGRVTFAVKGRGGGGRRLTEAAA